MSKQTRTQRDIEREFLGACMIISNADSHNLYMSLSLVKEQVFTLKKHKKIYKGIKRLFNMREDITPISVSETVKDTELADLIEMAKDTIVVANIYSTAQTLSNLAVERFSIQKLNECISIIGNDEYGMIEERIARANATWSEVQARVEQRETKLSSLQDCIDGVLVNVYDSIQGNGKKGYTTPFAELNKIIAPKNIPTGSLFVVGGLPKMGKTKVLTAFINHHLTKYKDEMTVIFSLEMKSEQMAERSLAQIGKLNSGHFCMTEHDDKKLDELAKARDMFDESHCYINDKPGIRIEDIEMQCRQLATDKKMGLIAIDYLTLMTPPKADRNDLAFGVITKRLKNLAKELDCYVLLLTQLNRGIMTRNNKRPYPQDSRDTGQIEQDCDFWMGVHKQSVFEDDTYNYKNVVELILRLNRHGDTGTVYCSDLGAYFVEYDRPPLGYQGGEE